MILSGILKLSVWSLHSWTNTKLEHKRSENSCLLAWSPPSLCVLPATWKQPVVLLDSSLKCFACINIHAVSKTATRRKIRTLKIKTLTNHWALLLEKALEIKLLVSKPTRISVKYVSFRLQFGMHFHPHFMFLPSLQFYDTCCLLNPYRDSIAYETCYILLYI